MNISNKQKKQIRRGVAALGSMLFVFSAMVYAGVELPFFNHYNPLYNPYIFILIGFILFVSRTYLKDKRGVGNFIDFFDRSGLVVASYEIPFDNISPTHANYVDKAGEKKAVRHTHPFAIPDVDVWSNEFLVPSTGLEALNPTALVKKYGPQLKDIDVTVTEMKEVEIETVDSKGVKVKSRAYQLGENTMRISKSIVQGVLSNLSAWIPEIMA